MKILGVDNIVIDVTDLDVARDFYGGGLGLAEKYFFPVPGLIGYRIGGEEPGLVIRLAPAAAAVGRPGPRIWLEVTDALESAAELEQRGVSAVGPPVQLRTGRLVEFCDPFGNVIGLVDYTQAPELARTE